MMHSLWTVTTAMSGSCKTYDMIFFLKILANVAINTFCELCHLIIIKRRKKTKKTKCIWIYLNGFGWALKLVCFLNSRRVRSSSCWRRSSSSFFLRSVSILICSSNWRLSLHRSLLWRLNGSNSVDDFFSKFGMNGFCFRTSAPWDINGLGFRDSSYSSRWKKEKNIIDFVINLTKFGFS